jgi:metal-responsive CopG/Arc/MetJ family transcriptional regulator
MRTSINLDPDVAAAVDRLRREKHIGLSEAVNELARAGLTARTDRSPFRQRSQDLGLAVGVSNVAEALEYLDSTEKTSDR